MYESVTFGLKSFIFRLYLVFFSKRYFKYSTLLARYSMHIIWRMPPLFLLARYFKPWFIPCTFPLVTVARDVYFLLSFSFLDV